MVQVVGRLVRQFFSFERYRQSRAIIKTERERQGVIFLNQDLLGQVIFLAVLLIESVVYYRLIPVYLYPGYLNNGVIESSGIPLSVNVCPSSSHFSHHGPTLLFGLFT